MLKRSTKLTNLRAFGLRHDCMEITNRKKQLKEAHRSIELTEPISNFGEVLRDPRRGLRIEPEKIDAQILFLRSRGTAAVIPLRN